MNAASERASPGGSTAFTCHWASRIVLVIEPSFSAAGAPGMKKTSTCEDFGSTPGSFQTAAVSVSKRSTTTIHSRFRIACRDILAFGLSTAGFWPMLMNPFTFYLPKREKADAYSHQHFIVGMLEKKVKGFISMGQNPAVDSPNAKMSRQALRSLEWLVVADLFETDTAAVWK